MSINGPILVSWNHSIKALILSILLLLEKVPTRVPCIGMVMFVSYIGKLYDTLKKILPFYFLLCVLVSTNF